MMSTIKVLYESQPMFVIGGLHHIFNIYYDQVKMCGDSFMFLQHYVRSVRRISPEFRASLFSSALIISMEFVADTVEVGEVFLRVLTFPLVSVILCSYFPRLPSVLYKLNN
jgi:hypothetical protein